MNIKYLPMYLLILSLPVGAVSAQSWYQSDLDSGYVKGANDSRGNSRKLVDITVLRKGNFTEISDMREMSKDERKKAIEELKSQKFEKRCLVIQENIDNRKDYYQNSYTNTISRYQGIVKSLSNMVEILERNDIDTTVLKVKIATLEIMVKDLNSTHDLMVSKMVENRSMACDKDAVKEYRNNVQSTTKTLKEEREQIIAMRKLVREEIVVLIQSLKSDLNSQEESENE